MRRSLSDRLETKVLKYGELHPRTLLADLAALPDQGHSKGAAAFRRQLAWRDFCADAAPYFRIFNPVQQGIRHDPHGAYVRRWVPELSGLAGKAAHEPWRHGGARGYPQPIVGHAEARQEALRRYAAIR